MSNPKEEVVKFLPKGTQVLAAVKPDENLPNCTCFHFDNFYI